MHSDIVRIIKSELTDAQKAFAQNPSSANWQRTMRAMLVFQQLTQLLKMVSTTPALDLELSFMYATPTVEWADRIVALATGMTIEEVLA